MSWQTTFVLTLSMSMNLLEMRAQTYLEVRGGFAINQLNQSFKSVTFENMEATNGIYVATAIVNHIKGPLFLEYGGELIQKNYHIRRASPFNSIYVQNNNYFIQVPISIRLSILTHKALQIGFSSGIFGGYWLSSTSDATIPNAFDSFNTFVDGKITQNYRVTKYSTKNDLSKSHYNRLGFGVLLKVSILYSINSVWLLSINTSYQDTFTSLEEVSSDNEFPSLNKTVVISTGLIYKLN